MTLKVLIEHIDVFKKQNPQTKVMIPLMLGGVITHPITMPVATRDAFIKQWNTSHRNFYGTSPEKLWAGSLEMRLCGQIPNFRNPSGVPEDVLVDIFRSTLVDVSMPLWREHLTNSWNDFEVQRLMLVKQIDGLIEDSLQKLLYVKFNIASLNGDLRALQKVSEIMYKASAALTPNFVTFITSGKSNHTSCLDYFKDVPLCR